MHGHIGQWVQLPVDIGQGAHLCMGTLVCGHIGCGHLSGSISVYGYRTLILGHINVYPVYQVRCFCSLVPAYIYNSNSTPCKQTCSLVRVLYTLLSLSQCVSVLAGFSDCHAIHLVHQAACIIAPFSFPHYLNYKIFGFTGFAGGESNCFSELLFCGLICVVYCVFSLVSYCVNQIVCFSLWAKVFI